MEILVKIKNLDKKNREIFERIYDIKEEVGIQKFPKDIEKKYKKLERQKILIVKNKILLKETHINPLRKKRQKPSFKNIVEKFCPFCNPKKYTPEDEVGRLENKYSISSSNLMKGAKNHSLIIFKKHKNFGLKDLEETLSLSFLWFKKNIGNKILIWNNLWRAGASIPHPHFQIFSLDTIPEKLKFIKLRLDLYKNLYKSDYFDDLFRLHKKLGLAKEKNGLRIIIDLAPFKENEIIILPKDWDKNIKEVSKLLFLYKKISESFNLFLFYDGNFKKIGFLVDRGSLKELNSDIGSLEIYSFSIVSSDPFELAKRLFKNRNSISFF
ncbi:MAG: hypothetical protein ACP5JU_01535 [Minisyncoccia bacterium]